jgi:hypothetical protein
MSITGSLSGIELRTGCHSLNIQTDCEILGSHRSEDDDVVLLGCGAV